jgi:oxalate decarboxylase
MSDPQRREFLAAAGMTSLAMLGAAQPAAGGDPSFMNNVPDPTLAGKDLPTFKFALEKSEGKVIGDSYGKEATVTQLPISKGIAGVSMRLEPGAMRELHWHATAAEWAFVVEGRVRTTVIDPGGLAETNDFDPGDVWYFRDWIHAGVHETIDLSQGNAASPKDVLATNFSQPAEAFGFPDRDVFISGKDGA